jgi:murein L,D-transpeptidase YcbB/YkuD
MKVARTAEGLDHRNTLVFNTLVIHFQCFPDKHGSDADRAIAGVPWTLHAEGRVVATGSTEADGAVRLSVPAMAHTELEILGTRYRVQAVPHLEEVTTVRGQQRRLSMLGYDTGGVDGDFGRKTDKAVLDFQANHGLDPDGVVGNLTRTRLTSQFGE